MIQLEEIQDRIAEELKRTTIAQKNIAEKLQVNQSVISQYRHKTTKPQICTFANLCDLLELDANEILGITRRITVQNDEEQYSQKLNKRNIDKKFIEEVFIQLSKEDQFMLMGYATALLDKHKRQNKNKTIEIADKVQAEFIEKKNNKE